MRANLPRYRHDDEEQAWRVNDPIARLEEDLRDLKAYGDAEAIILRTEVEKLVDGCVEFAKASQEPQIETMIACVTSAPVEPEPLPAAGTRALTYTQAINEAMTQEMDRDDSVFVIGEDVGRIGGIFGATRGLYERFGPDRVIDAPISEMGIAGTAVGAAISGKRPIVEIQIFDFVTLMMDMIVNQAAKFRFMLGGKPSVPVVFRGPQGGGVRLAAQHSQSLEAWFTHIPGLIVLAPSTPYDAKGLMTAAIRDNNPVVFLEHKLLYLGKEAPVPEAPYAIPIGKADIKRGGTDVTVIATMAMVEKALAAAEQLARDGISVEVIDPRTLRPLDMDTMIDSVRKTNRCVIVHEACKTGGLGAEISARIMEEAFDWLDAPVVRVAAPDVPMPYNDRLERAVIPSVGAIVAAIRTVCYRS